MTLMPEIFVPEELKICSGNDSQIVAKLAEQVAVDLSGGYKLSEVWGRCDNGHVISVQGERDLPIVVSFSNGENPRLKML